MSDLAAEPPIFATPRRQLGAGVRAARRSDGVLVRRWFGCWIDFLVLWFLAIATVAAVALVSEAAALWVGLLAVLAYFPVTEGLWGRSLGKLASGTIVVDAEGNLPGFGRAIVRTLTRLIEVNPLLLGGIPAGLIASLTKDHQRLGDLLARTYVVRVKDLAAARARISARELEVFD